MTTPRETLDVPGMACVDLTPTIAAALRGLQPGEVLEVHADDPAARVGVPAWCRLTGHRLLHTTELGTHRDPADPRTTFHIAKKENQP